MNLNKFTVEELQAEIERRAKYRVDIQETVFELTLDEIKTLQAALNKLNPPPDPMEEYRKMMEKRQNDQTPWKERPLIWPDKYRGPEPQNPWKTAPYNDPPIWCKQHPDSFEVWTTSSKPVDPFRISLDNPQAH